MRTSDTINELATALAKARAEIKSPVNNRTVTVKPRDGGREYKFSYAELPAVLDAITPALSANGLALAQATITMTDGLHLTTRLIHSSGQWLESSYPILDDRARPQAMGAAITYARRYSICALCNIASDEDDDANSVEGNEIKTNGNGFPPGNKDVKYTKYPVDAKPTPGVVRARDNNAFYQRMETEILAERTKDGLRRWRKMREQDLAEGIGPDAMLDLSDFYENHMETLL
jgi:hypothetical protein